MIGWSLGRSLFIGNHSCQAHPHHLDQEELDAHLMLPLGAITALIGGPIPIYFQLMRRDAIVV